MILRAAVLALAALSVSATAATKHAGEDVAEAASPGAALGATAEHVPKIESAEVEALRACSRSGLTTWKTAETARSGRAATCVGLGGCGIDVVRVKA